MRRAGSLTTALMIIAVLLVVRLWLGAIDLASRKAVFVVGGVIVVGLLLAVGVGIALFELSVHREGETERLQRRLTARLRRAIGDRHVTAVVQVPGSRRWPLVIEIAGRLSTEEEREVVLGVVRHEASRLGREARVADRLEVRPTTERSAA